MLIQDCSACSFRCSSSGTPITHDVTVFVEEAEWYNQRVLTPVEREGSETHYGAGAKISALKATTLPAH